MYLIYKVTKYDEQLFNPLQMNDFTVIGKGTLTFLCFCLWLQLVQYEDV